MAMNVSNLETPTSGVNSTMSPDCFEPDTYQLSIRIWLTVVCGITVASISILFNSFIFLVFSTNRQHRNSPNLYLLLLSMFDVFISVAYIAVMSVRVLINYTASYFLKSIWVQYMVPMLTVSHIGITSSTYLIVFVSIERFCLSVDNFLVPYLHRHRPLLALIAMMSGVVSKGTMLFEVKIATNPECEGALNYWTVAPTSLVLENAHFNKYWRFYFRNVFTILEPFFILLLVNFLLLCRLYESHRRQEFLQDKQSVKAKKARIRAATQSIAIVVCTYLFSNLLSVVITIWEYWSSSLFSDRFLAFYVLSVDVISILTIVASSLRLPIYVICQPLLRKEMFQFITQACAEEKRSRRMTLLENFPPPSDALIQTIDPDTPSYSKIEFV